MNQSWPSLQVTAEEQGTLGSEWWLPWASLSTFVLCPEEFIMPSPLHGSNCPLPIQVFRAATCGLEELCVGVGVCVGVCVGRGGIVLCCLRTP